jgi:hypothetical protein
MLQVFSYGCCKKKVVMLYMLQCCIRMLQASIPNISSAFSDVCCKCAYLILHMSHTYVVRVCSKYFSCFSLYVAISVLMLQVFYLYVAYVSHTCCKCMFQMFHPFQTYVAFKCFHVASILCFRGMFRDSCGHDTGAGRRGAARAVSTISKALVQARH